MISRSIPGLISSRIKSINMNSFRIEDWDHILDVRSPCEYLEDSIPGSRNIPVLTDSQRIEVGTLYKNDLIKAKQLGAMYISANISTILKSESFGKKETIAVYCMKGGDRSLSLAHVFSRIGLNVTLLEGGYKAFRKSIRQHFKVMVEKVKIHSISGLSGCGKGLILSALKQEGAQVIDLEDLAKHRGSVFGSNPKYQFIQPSQKAFETQLWNVMRNMHYDRPIFVEAESKKIGYIHLPNEFHVALKLSNGGVTRMHVDIEQRVQFLRKCYSHLETTHVHLLIQSIKELKSFVGKDKIDRWLNLVELKNWNQLVYELLKDHYDPLYTKSSNLQNVSECSLLGFNQTHLKKTVKTILNS